MIWFRIKNLEQKIAGNQLSEKEGLSYLLATVIALYFTGNNLPGISPLLTFMIELPIIIITILMAYKINSDTDNKDFFKRYLAINWVVNINIAVYFLIFMLFMFVCMLVFVLVLREFFNLATFSTLFHENIRLIQSITLGEFLVLITACYCLLMVKSFKRLKLNFQKSNGS